MSCSAESADIDAIRTLIARQFDNLDWAPGRPANWAAFAGDFLPGATLVPSARPVKRWTVGQFIDRMTGLSATSLESFEEKALDSQVLAFGNVAVALATCENLENGTEVSRNKEAMLLVKDGGVWRIVAQAWDNAP